MKTFFVVVVSFLILTAFGAFAVLYGPIILSPRAANDAFLVPVFTPEGEMEVRQVAMEERAPTLLELLLWWRDVPQTIVTKFEIEEPIILTGTPLDNVIAFRCPDGTGIPMRGMVPPINYDSNESYWYYGPYEESPNQTVIQRFNARQTPMDVFGVDRFGGNIAAKADLPFLNENRPVLTGGLYLLSGNPLQKSITIRCVRECGDGILDEDIGEKCDDKNINDGDGCSGGCTIESTCGNGIVEDGEACDDAMTCSNGMWCINPEECDEGLCIRRDGDGCSIQCEIEELFSCDGMELGDRTNCTAIEVLE